MDMVEKVEQIEAAIAALKKAVVHLKKGHVWSAYKIAGHVSNRMYFVRRDCAHISPRAAMDWGCGVRLPNGKLGILRDF